MLKKDMVSLVTYLALAVALSLRCLVWRDEKIHPSNAISCDNRIHHLLQIGSQKKMNDHEQTRRKRIS
jgi:hypothetical protein